MATKGFGVPNNGEIVGRGRDSSCDVNLDSKLHALIIKLLKNFDENILESCLITATRRSPLFWWCKSL